LDGWQDVLGEGKFFGFNGGVHRDLQCVLGGGNPFRPGNSGASSLALGIFNHKRSIRRRCAIACFKIMLIE